MVRERRGSALCCHGDRQSDHGVGGAHPLQGVPHGEGRADRGGTVIAPLGVLDDEDIENIFAEWKAMEVAR